MNRIKEADIKDKKGNIIVSAGLKVRHKKSQFEYTIDSVVQDKGGQIVVLLRKEKVYNHRQSKITCCDL